MTHIGHAEASVHPQEVSSPCFPGRRRVSQISHLEGTAVTQASAAPACVNSPSQTTWHAVNLGHVACMVGLGSVLGVRHHVAGERSGGDVPRMPFGVAGVAARCGQPGAGTNARRGAAVGAWLSPVRRAGNVPSLASDEVRRPDRSCNAAWALDVRAVAISPSRHGARACAFALAPATSTRVQSVGIAGAWLGPELGACGGAFPVGQVSAQALADGVLAGGAHACVGGLLRGHAHPECEEGGGGRRCVDHGCDVPNLRPGVGG